MITVHDLDRSRKDAALDVLCAAFRDYPVTRYVVGETDLEYDSKTRALFGFFVESRLLRGVPLIGLSEGEDLLGVAVVSPPEEIPMPPELRQCLAQVEELLGKESMARFFEYDAACDATDPGKVAHYLGMIAVLPGTQRRGCGRRLIDAVKDRARSHPVSTGITLNTEAESNLPFYESVGFQRIAEADAGPLHTWSFYWAR